MELMKIRKNTRDWNTGIDQAYYFPLATLSIEISLIKKS
jgi:hypothetical protein